MPQTLRTFIAIELPEEVKAVIGQAQARLAASNLPFKWVNPRAMHLTLKFLGDVLESDIDGITQVMEQCVVYLGPMTFSAGGFGAFPGFKNPRVVWVGLTGDTAALVKLASSLETGLEPLGFTREIRPFSAHITLGRTKGRVDGQALAKALERAGQCAANTFRAEGVALFKSDLKPSGAVYTRLFRAAFGRGDA